MAALIVLSVVALAALAAVGVVRGLIHLCQPNEVLVISGTAAGRGYKIVQGGRGLVVPLLEKVDRLDLTNMIIEIRVLGAYSKGGIPLNVEGVANIKIASTQPILGNAIERFLGKPRQEIMRVARETLEGNLRGVLATLTPEEVNQDRVKFAQSLLTEADTDLKRLGLVLDTLKIQNVSDDRGYLDSIGRKQSAELQMRSRIAEADNRATAAERDAKNFEEKELARLDAALALARAEAEQQLADARTKKAAMVAEQKAQVTALVARADAERGVQRARMEQVRLQLEADRIRPAEANREQMQSHARGEAASIVEEGRATAEALRLMNRAFQEAGDEAPRIVVAQKLPALVGSILETVHDAPIGKVTVVEKELTGRGSLPAKAAVASEVLAQASGLDLRRLLGA